MSGKQREAEYHLKKKRYKMVLKESEFLCGWVNCGYLVRMFINVQRDLS